MSEASDGMDIGDVRKSSRSMRASDEGVPVSEKHSSSDEDEFFICGFITLGVASLVPTPSVG